MLVVLCDNADERKVTGRSWVTALARFAQVFSLDITSQLRAYEVEYHVLQEEMSYNAAQQDARQLIRKLQSENSSLRQQNHHLVEQLNCANARTEALETQIQNMISGESKLKSHVRTLELERTALLNAVTKLRKLLTDDVIDVDEVKYSAAVSTNACGPSSPFLYPAVDRILQEEVILQGAGSPTCSSSNSSLNSVGGRVSVTSLNGFDTEVAALTRSCNSSPVTLNHVDATRPSSTSY